jgi:hypothetical protein
MAGERHGNSMVCVNPPEGWPTIAKKVDVIYTNKLLFTKE